MSEFREVLHAWAAKTLADKAGHTGPFEIREVRIMHSAPSSISSESLDVWILFDHGGLCSWSAEYLARNGYPPCAGRTSWMLYDTTNTVDMLNELLALGDAQ